MAKEEFIGKEVKADFVQEFGWKRPVKVEFDEQVFEVKEVLRRWEEHTLSDPWYVRKHRVWYEVIFQDGSRAELYWDRGPKGLGKAWVLVKIIREK